MGEAMEVRGQSKITMSVFKAPKPSLPGKDRRPNAGERGHVKLTNVCGTNNPN